MRYVPTQSLQLPSSNVIPDKGFLECVCCLRLLYPLPLFSAHRVDGGDEEHDEEGVADLEERVEAERRDRGE